MERDALEETQRSDPQHLITPNDKAPLRLETKIEFAISSPAVVILSMRASPRPRSVAMRR